MLKYFLSVFFIVISLVSSAATVILTNGDIIVGAEVISIQNGEVVLIVEKKVVIIPANQIKAYYEEDLKKMDDFIKNQSQYCDYKIRIDIAIKSAAELLDAQLNKMDDTSSSRLKRSSRLKKKSHEAQIKYSINRIADKNKKIETKINTPVMILTILYQSTDPSHTQFIKYFSYPKGLKMEDGMNYGLLLDFFSSSKRGVIDFEKLKEKKKGLDSIYDFECSIPLEGDNEDFAIIGWHLDVWGKSLDAPIYTKEWTRVGINVGEEWWKNTDFINNGLEFNPKSLK